MGVSSFAGETLKSSMLPAGLAKEGIVILTIIPILDLEPIITDWSVTSFIELPVVKKSTAKYWAYFTVCGSVIIYVTACELFGGIFRSTGLILIHLAQLLSIVP